MKLGWATSIVFAALIVAGCQQQAKDATDRSATIVKGTTGGTTGAEATAGDQDSRSTTSGDDVKEAPPQIPANLQNDAFHYYSLSRTEPANYQVTIADRAPDTGTETVKFIGMENGKAKFDIDRTGALEQMGSEHVTLDDKGVTIKSTSPGTLQTPFIDMPSSLKPGSHWTTDYTVKLDGQGTLHDHSTFTVVGPQKVTVKAGTFDALLVESTGSDSQDGTNYQIKTQSWYVKDRGAVKIVVSTVRDKKTTTLSIEAVPGDPK